VIDADDDANGDAIGAVCVTVMTVLIVTDIDSSPTIFYPVPNPNSIPNPNPNLRSRKNWMRKMRKIR
jgi:hypothetical protein